MQSKFWWGFLSSGLHGYFRLVTLVGRVVVGYARFRNCENRGCKKIGWIRGVEDTAMVMEICRAMELRRTVVDLFVGMEWNISGIL